MLRFEMEGVRVEIRAELEHYEYTDENRHNHSRFERKIKILVLFWDFIIGGDLQELSLIKSSLLYFMQGYWKRSGKEASKIDLSTQIGQHYPGIQPRTLRFSVRQKYKKNFLHVSLHSNNLLQHEVYLDGQQVLMLDVAIGKALHYLTPPIFPWNERDGTPM